MMRALLIALISFISIVSAARATVDKDKTYGLVVSSDYTTPQNQKITISGSGIVVTDIAYDNFDRDRSKAQLKYGFDVTTCLHCRYFVITASHVSKGANTRVVVDGKPRTILGRYADVIRDIEILEIKNEVDLHPQAFYYPKIKGFVTVLVGGLTSSERVMTDDISSQRYNVVDVSNGPGIRIADNFVVAPSYPTCEPPKPHEPEQTEKSPSNWISGILIHSGYDEVVVNAWLPPGFSGSPMFHQLGAGYRLDGIVTEYDRRQQISYLTTQNAIGVVYLEYLKGAHGVKSYQGTEWSWKHNGLTTYREGRDRSGTLRIKETELIHGNAGSSSAGEAGHGSGGDGGNSCHDQVDLTKKLSDGVWIDGQQIFAFKRKDGYVLAADVQSYAFYEDTVQSVIPWGSELLDLFKHKLLRAIKFTPGFERLTGKDMWLLAGRPLPLVQYRLNSDSITLFMKDSAFDDSFEITINKFGGVGTDPYKRLLDVRSKKGVIYTLDLTGLFVIDFKNSGFENQITDFAAPFIFVQRAGETARYMDPVVDFGDGK